MQRKCCYLIIDICAVLGFLLILKMVFIFFSCLVVAALIVLLESMEFGIYGFLRLFIWLNAHYCQQHSFLIIPLLWFFEAILLVTLCVVLVLCGACIFSLS